MGNKIYKITKLFDRVVQLKNRGITYWAERNGLVVVWIIRELKNRFLLPVNYLDNRWPTPFSPISDPSVFEVVYLTK